MATRSEAVATGTVQVAEDALRGYPRPWRILPFLGPAFVACVAYIDPGNFATNIAGGSKFGLTLCWVILASNLMAMLIQTLSAKLGIATGRNLPEVCRAQFSRRTSVALWIQAELIAMATDLAEFLGAALGFHLLLGIGLFLAAVITGFVTFAILGLQRIGLRTFEAVIAAFVATIGACYLAEIWYAHPDLSRVALHAVKPDFAGSESVLLASGLSSSTVGTLSGQVVMQGFIDRKIPVFVRRLVTMLPALVVAAIGVDPSRTLVISQVILSFGIPFALVPLVWFTSRRDLMGPLVNRRATTAVAVAVAGLISLLNVFLLGQTFGLA